MYCFIRGEFQHFSWKKASYRRKTQVKYYRKKNQLGFIRTTHSFNYLIQCLLFHDVQNFAPKLLSFSSQNTQGECPCNATLKFAGGFLSASSYILLHYILLKEGSWKLTPFFPPKPFSIWRKLRFGARITPTCIINCRAWEQFCWDVRGRWQVGRSSESWSYTCLFCCKCRRVWSKQNKVRASEL